MPIKESVKTGFLDDVLYQTEKQTWNYRPMGSNPIQEIQEIHEQFSWKRVDDDTQEATTMAITSSNGAPLTGPISTNNG